MFGVIGMVDDQIACAVMPKAAMSRATPPRAAPRSFDQHGLPIALHQGAAFPIDIRSNNVLSSPTGDEVVGGELAAAIII